MVRYEVVIALLEAELASIRKANTSPDASSARLAVGGCSRLDSLRGIAAVTVEVAGPLGC